MVEAAVQEIREIRRLLADPTPENYERVTGKLENIVVLLERLTQHADGPDGKQRALLSGLPAEMAMIRRLMETPLRFYQCLQALRAAHFGAYERSGTIRSLEPQLSSTTLIHL
jgi:hypothetical protein